MGGWNHDGMRGGSTGNVWLAVLLAIVLLLQVATLVLVLTGVTVGRRAAGEDSAAQRVLDERLARGEITADDYRAARSLLGS